MSTCTAPWKPGGSDGHQPIDAARDGAKGLPNWRIVRYADDFVVLADGDRQPRCRACARTSLRCSHHWGCGSQRPRPGSCT